MVVVTVHDGGKLTTSLCVFLYLYLLRHPLIAKVRQARIVMTLSINLTKMNT